MHQNRSRKWRPNAQALKIQEAKIGKHAKKAEKWQTKPSAKASEAILNVKVIRFLYI